MNGHSCRIWWKRGMPPRPTYTMQGMVPMQTITCTRCGLQKPRYRQRCGLCRGCYLQYCRDYYQHNKDAKAEAGRAYRSANPEKNKARHTKYRRARLPQHVLYVQAYRARKATAPQGYIPNETLEIIVFQAGGLCRGCGQPFTEKLRPTIDHIVPLSKGGAHAIENLQALCRSCNSTKNNRRRP